MVSNIENSPHYQFIRGYSADKNFPRDNYKNYLLDQSKESNSKSLELKIDSFTKSFSGLVLLSLGSKSFLYYSSSNSKNHLYNLLATLTTISLFFDLKNVPKNIFLDFKLPEGRGDYSKLKFKNN